MDLAAKHAQLEKLRPLAPAAVRSLADAWDVRMVYESNSIEGNPLSLRETSMVILEDLVVAGKPFSAHAACHDLWRAWQQMRFCSAPEAAFQESDLLDFHRIALSSSDDVLPGSYRLFEAKVSRSNLVPAEAYKIRPSIKALIKSLSSISDPVTRAAKIHHGILSILPFNDGNGQMARLAMNFVLLAAGYPPVSISPELRTTYYAALEAADSGDFPTWLAFITTRLNEEFDWWLEALNESAPAVSPAVPEN